MSDTMSAELAAAFAELTETTQAQQDYYATLPPATPEANSVTVYPPTPGGPFTTFQAAINSIPSTGPQDRYMVVAGAGTFTEDVKMIPFTTVQGSGSDVTTLVGAVTAASDSNLGSMTIKTTDASYSISAAGVTNLGVNSCVIANDTVGTYLINGVEIDGRNGKASASFNNVTFSINATKPADNFPIGIGAIGDALVVMTSGSLTTRMDSRGDTAVQAAKGASFSIKYASVTATNLALETDAKSDIYIAGCTIVGKTSGRIHET
jgi:hypothetical protein